MLPGFRFLFTAIALTMSILIFGLGAAALLRAAHEEFASVPPWRAAPETMFAQPNEASPPVLAMLRVEPRVEEQKNPDKTPAEVSTAEPAADASNPDEPTAAAAPETAKLETSTDESSDQDRAATAQADAPTGNTDTAETKVAANEAISVPLNEPVASVTERREALVSPNSASANPTIASAKVATPGNPPVLIDAPRPAKTPTAKADKAKPNQDAIRKRLQARQAAQRRRIALRARLAQQQQLRPADPFAQPPLQPTVQPVTAARNR
jgi:hypothetical protein